MLGWFSKCWELLSLCYIDGVNYLFPLENLIFKEIVLLAINDILQHKKFISFKGK